MSASDHLQPEQLRMFMPARELRSMESSEVTAFGSPAQMWKDKARDNRRDQMNESVAKHGVLTPVEVAYGFNGKDDRVPLIWGGHHRIQAAYEHDPDMLVPVRHHDLASQRRYGAVWQPHDDPRETTERFPSYP